MAFQADPDSALRGLEEPILLDEWQVIPEVLGAVKRAVDTDPRPGRFLLTGSVRADLDAPTWPGTGRLVRVPMFGMTIAERRGRPRTKPLLDRLVQGDVLAVPRDAPDLRGYVELALQSGFPEAALGLSERARSRWVESYLDQLLTRDAIQLGGVRDPAKLRRYFEAYALNSAGLVEEKTLFEAAGLNRKTAMAYEQLLVNLMVVDRTSPWRSNRLKRLVRAPKRYVTDAALLAGMVRLDAGGILREGDLLGRLPKTFVASQIRAELAVARASTICGRNRAATKSICWPRYLQHGSSVSRSRPALRLARTPHNIWFGCVTNYDFVEIVLSGKSNLPMATTDAAVLESFDRSHPSWPRRRGKPIPDHSWRCQVESSEYRSRGSRRT